eukprot:gene9062-18771_t
MVDNVQRFQTASGLVSDGNVDSGVVILVPETNCLAPVEMASVLIQMAFEDHEEFHLLFHSSLARKSFHLHHKFKYITQIASMFLLLLTFFERPAWTTRKSNWNDPGIYPMSNIPFLPESSTLAIESVLLSIIAFDYILQLLYSAEMISNFKKSLYHSIRTNLTLSSLTVVLLLRYSNTIDGNDNIQK